MLEIVQDEYKRLFKLKLRQIHKKKVGLFSGTSFLKSCWFGCDWEV